MIHEVSAQHIPAQTDMSLECTTGDTIQIDWGEVTIHLRKEQKVVQISVASSVTSAILCHALPKPECR